MKYYGSLENRLMENQKEIPTIEVGMGVTEYLYSDSHAYEVTKIINQKDVFIRRYKAKHIGEYGNDEWELISDPAYPEQEVVFRYGKWYQKDVITKEDYEKIIKERGYVLISDKEYDDIMKKGKAIRYNEMKLVFGYANESYDFSF